MKNLSLTAELRSPEEKTKHLRKNSIIPAVVYGHSQEPISLKLNYSDFLKLFRISGESQIISLNVDKKNIDVLVHDIQREPVSGDYTHIDFYAITKGEVVTTKIHLHFINSSNAVKNEGALLEEHIKEIEVKCLPTDLVEGFDVDLSKLKTTGDMIRVSDLGINKEKFEILTNSDDVVAAVSAPAKVEIEETTEVTEEGDEEASKEEKTKE